jgi:hypothetical protein
MRPRTTAARRADEFFAPPKSLLSGYLPVALEGLPRAVWKA